MSRLDELPPDQRAALSLLLGQSKSYAEVAALLGIGEQAVHDRAHAALAVLAPAQARGLSPALRAEVGDYLLGQQAGAGERLRTRTFLAGSEAGRAWALAVTTELAPLGKAQLADIPPPERSPAPPAPPPAPASAAAGAAAAGTPPPPAGPAVAPAPAGSRTSGAASPGPAPAAAAEPAPSAAGAPAEGAPTKAIAEAPAPGGPAAPRSSRRGGALLLLGIVVAVLLVVFVIVPLASSGSHHKNKSATTPSKTATGPTVTARVPLRPTNPASHAVGVVDVLSEGSRRAFFVVAEHLPSTHNFYYALWLYNSPTSFMPLSKSPPIGSSHRLEGGSVLPSNAAQFKEILLTHETASRPKNPGTVVLHGPFKVEG
jgi:hypothetical protein